MVESDEQRKERIKDEKEVQYYMALVTAWINTRMEHDKTLITISAGGIGLLTTILTTKGTAETWHIWLFGLAFCCYLIAIFTAIAIFHENAVRLEQEVRKEDINHDMNLEKLDKVARWSFIIGTVSFAMIGVLSALAKPKEADIKKDQEKQQMVEREKPAEVEKNFSNNIYISNNAPPSANYPAVKSSKAQKHNPIQNYYSSTCSEKPRK